MPERYRIKLKDEDIYWEEIFKSLKRTFEDFRLLKNSSEIKTLILTEDLKSDLDTKIPIIIDKLESSINKCKLDKDKAYEEAKLTSENYKDYPHINPWDYYLKLKKGLDNLISTKSFFKTLRDNINKKEVNRIKDIYINLIDSCIEILKNM